MPNKRKNLPEFYRRAIRLAINVGISAITGYSLVDTLGGWHSLWGGQLMQGTKWAAITSVVCNHPVISKTTEAALERVLGTVSGGLLGYGLAVALDSIPNLDHQFITILALMLVAFTSIILGYKFKVDYAGRLFIMTFILVAMVAPKKSDAFVVAVTRISGIVYGVILTMVMSVIVFPKSASHQATDNLQVGLTKLAELNKVAWHKGHGCTALSDIMHPPLFSTMSAEWQGGGRDCVDVVVGSDANNHVLDEGADECCDEALSEVYARLATCQEFTVMSKSETYIFTTRGRWVFFPAFRCFPWRTALPNKEMGQVTTAARKVARLLWCLHTSLPEEDDVSVVERYCGAGSFLTSLGDSLQVYLENLAASFPNQQNLESSELYTFIQGVETLIAASHRATGDSTILLKPSGGAMAARVDVQVPRTPPAGPTSAESPRAFSAPSSLADRNVAFICKNGSVTRVAGLNITASFAKEMAARDGDTGHEHFSPVSELLPEGSSTEEVLRAAAEAAIAEDSREALTSKRATKEGYISQVRWQATQFLLRRLTRELTILNSAFIRLSVMLPPTRWESRRRKVAKGSLTSEQEPLLGV